MNYILYVKLLDSEVNICHVTLRLLHRTEMMEVCSLIVNNALVLYPYISSLEGTICTSVSLMISDSRYHQCLRHYFGGHLGCQTRKLDVMYILWVFSVREKKEEEKTTTFVCMCFKKRIFFVVENLNSIHSLNLRCKETECGCSV